MTNILSGFTERKIEMNGTIRYMVWIERNGVI